jgi:hypothetical protein
LLNAITIPASQAVPLFLRLQGAIMKQVTRTSLVNSALIGFILWLCPTAQAKPAHQKALAEYLGPFQAAKLNDCRTCHLPATDKEDDHERPHNPFGARLKAVKKELAQAGKPTDLASRLDTIADEDSDGDGVPNLVELLAGRLPGDPNDKPSATEIATARDKLSAFAKFRNGYRWKPFEVVKRPAVPKVKSAAWLRNPIDTFIAAEHEERGLQPGPEAPRHVLVRRLYFDLIGLPPTGDELESALNDPAAQWYEKVVNSLLQSPHYGERWGRHWMDIWRYSDAYNDGGDNTFSKPNIWRWRNWIIESINADKGYDRMIVEMLAGDELAPEDEKIVSATGYLARSFNHFYREQWLQEMVDHTFQAFLGVRLGCARCHDHMYDPITQEEYYRVRAVFEPLSVRMDTLPASLKVEVPKRLEGQLGAMLAPNGFLRVFDKAPGAKTFLFQQGDEKKPGKTPLDPGVPAALGGRFAAIRPVPLPPAVYAPDKRPFVVQQKIEASKVTLTKPRQDLAKARKDVAKSLAQTLADNPLMVSARLAASQKSWDTLALAELDLDIAEARLAAIAAGLQADLLEIPGKQETEECRQAARTANVAQRRVAAVVARRNLLALQQGLRNASDQARAGSAKQVADAEKVLAKAEADEKAPATTTYAKDAKSEVHPQTSTGRRLALARWIADKDNPLTARVAVNHIWLRHFGQAIVPTVFDFGRNGQPPSHPALLDWLAAELMERDWSMKAMHRLIVLSSTYRMASTANAENIARDRDNKYLWRANSRRLEAEIVRDSVFQVAGTLDRAVGGTTLNYENGKDMTEPRRSLYFHYAGGLMRMEFLKIFDGAEPAECYQRNETIQPQQALALLNSELTVRQSRLLARKLSAEISADPAAFVRAAFVRVLGRPPEAEDLADCLAFLQQQTDRHAGQPLSSSPRGSGPAGAPDQSPAADPALRAKENLIHVLMNHHEFVTVR